jgi:hypothetical protein
MVDYSGTLLAKKLGIKEGSTVLLRLAPEDFGRALAPLPTGAKVGRSGRAPADVTVFFAAKRSVLHRDLAGTVAKLKPHGGLWLAWPKKSSGRLTDLEENSVRTAVLAAGLVDNKICAIDDTWSGLCFVYRLRDRAEVASSKRRIQGPARPSRRRP